MRDKMKKFVAFMAFLLFCTNSLRAQVWTELGDSEIYIFERVDSFKTDSFYKYFRIFKKQNNAIIVPESFFIDFVALFEESAISFDSVFKYSFYKLSKDDMVRFESDTTRLHFERAVVIYDITKVKRKRNSIWRVTVLGNPNSCFVNVHVRSYNHGMRRKLIRFIKASDEGCEL